MVGMLGRGVGDIGVANFYITALEGRREFTDYSTPFGQEESCFLLRKEAPSPRWQSLALPFTGDTWLGILVVVSLMGPIFYCLASFSTTRKESLAEHSLVFTSLYTIGVTLRVSRPFLPNHPSLQVFLVFLWLYVIIVTVAYCANLTAFLTVERVPEGITSLQELYNSPLLVYGQGPFFGDNMAEAKNQYVKGLADRFFAMSNIEEIYKKLISGYGVYISSRNHLVYTGSSYASSVGVPTLRIIPECFQPFNVAIGLQSHSPLKRYFDTAVLWLTEGGFLHHWFDETLLQARIYRMSEKETEEEDKNIKGNAKEKEFSGIQKNIALTVEHIQGTFMILGIGCGISYLAFIIECSAVTLLRK
ncbi:ionotropic receptor 93a-like [Scylla paramamosain]|uniref:ionotropic receptor 93a-like n=1 Tax=Scylla paramamosain TaxID=85552 RepID=UPI003083C538